MSIHTIVFTVLTCVVALHREGAKLMVVEELDLAAIAATVGSLARLVYDTHQNYRQNGAWICFNLIMVSVSAYATAIYLCLITNVCAGFGLHLHPHAHHRRMHANECCPTNNAPALRHAVHAPPI